MRNTRNQAYVLTAIVLLLTAGCATIFPAAEPKATPAPAATAAPAAAPAEPSEYVLGAGDEIKSTVWRYPDLSVTTRISSAGRIHYPLIGEIKAAGLTSKELRDRIKDGLAKYVVDPQVQLDISSFRSKKVYVFGEVKKPGLFVIEDAMSAVEAVSLAGGFTLDARRTKVLLVRKQNDLPFVQLLDLESVLKEGNLSQNVGLQQGDVLYVPPSIIANVDRFFNHLATILAPIVDLERAMLLGNELNTIFSGKSTTGGGTTVIIGR